LSKGPIARLDAAAKGLKGSYGPRGSAATLE
jgi:hypothetical protein